MSCQTTLAREHQSSQALICTIRNGRIDDQNHTSLDTSPQPRNAVLVDDLLRRGEYALLLAFSLCLLPCGDDGNRDCEDLGQRSGDGTHGELGRSAGGLVGSVEPFLVLLPHQTVPVEVGKVGAHDSEQVTGQTIEEARDALLLHDVPHGM
jgi:hypothetical protein